MTDDDSVSGLQAAVRAFVNAREWGQFHTPRNLVLALLGEAGELAAEFQWVPDSEVLGHLSTPEGRAAFEDELADVVIYLLRLADVTGVDVAAVVRGKLAKNETRYPVEHSRGNSRKHDQLPGSGSGANGDTEWRSTS